MKLLVLVISLLFCNCALALTGEDLYSLYSSGKKEQRDLAYTYVYGYIDSQNVSNSLITKLSKNQNTISPNALFVCVPESGNFGQGSDIVKRYLEENPSKRNMPASMMVYDALITVWRCPNR